MAGSAGTRGMSFVFFMLIARVLSPEHLGVMALALAVSVFVDAVIDLGLSDQVIRLANDDNAFFSSVFWTHLSTASAGSVLLAALAPLAAHWYREPTLQWAMYGVALNSLFTGLSLVPQALLVRRMHHKSLALRNTLATLIGGVLGLSLAYAGWTVMALVVMTLANALTGMLAVWWSAQWRPLRPGSWQHRARQLRPVMAMARHTMGTRVVETLVTRMDQVLIGTFFGTATLGLYALAVRLYDVLFLTVCAPIASVMLPYLSRTTHDAMAFKARFLLVLKTTALAAPPIYVCAACYLPALLPTLFGDKWLAAGPYIQIMMGMGAVQAMSFTHTPAFTALGKPQANWWVTVVSSTMWLGSLFLLPKLGPLFAAVLWAGRSAVGVLMQVVFLRRLAGVSLADYWANTRFTWISSALVILLAWATDAGAALGWGGLGGAVACLALSTALLAATAWLASDEIRHTFLRLIKR